MDQPFLREVSIEGDDTSGFIVGVDFNANDNFSNDFIRGGIEARRPDLGRQ
jgi:hypothetical protein